MRRVRFSFLGALALVALAAGCNSILDFGSFGFNPSDAGPSTGDANAIDGGDAGNNNNNTDGGTEAGCDVDLTKACYACTPTDTDQFLNSCNSGITTCETYDNSVLTGLLLSDGGLPPSVDGGAP